MEEGVEGEALLIGSRATLPFWSQSVGRSVGFTCGVFSINTQRPPPEAKNQHIMATSILSSWATPPPPDPASGWLGCLCVEFLLLLRGARPVFYTEW